MIKGNKQDRSFQKNKKREMHVEIYLKEIITETCSACQLLTEPKVDHMQELKILLNATCSKMRYKYELLN